MIGGCAANGGVSVLTTAGEPRAGFEVGGEAAILAHDSTRHHLFVRGDPGPTLDILAVRSNGGMSVLATVEIPETGHGATVDGRGHGWVCDANAGGVVRISDPFPPTN